MYVALMDVIHLVLWEKLKLLVPEGILHLQLCNDKNNNKPKLSFLSGFLLIDVASILLVKLSNCRRGSGGRGFISGAGETELQLQRRRLNL